MFELFAPVFVWCCWKWGDWKNWRVYYTTILYMILVNFLTNFLTANYPLWEYGQLINNHTLCDIFVAFTVFPSTIMLYLPYYPLKISRQVMYVTSWVLLYSAIEYIGLITGNFCYKNGWNIWYSIGFNIILFIMLKLHYNHPLLTWPISAVLMIVILGYFKLPIGLMR